MGDRIGAIIFIVIGVCAAAYFAITERSIIPISLAAGTGLGFYTLGKLNGYRKGHESGWSERHDDSTPDEREAWRTRNL